MGIGEEALAATLGGAASSADLGGRANIQVRPLKTEVEKGSTVTAVGRGLMGPRDREGPFPGADSRAAYRTGIRSTFRNRVVDFRR